ncbi:MAG: DUF6624 domain-containing protein [Pirellulaceae bacterium]
MLQHSIVLRVVLIHRFQRDLAAEASIKQTTIFFVVWLSGFVALADDVPKPTLAKQPELRSELLHRTKTDQDARQALITWMNDHGANGVVVTAFLSKEKQADFEKVSAQVKGVDEDNTQWLKGVVERHGWPSNTMAGEDGANAAWLLVQHADAEPKFQRKCLDLMAKLQKGEVSPANLAYLTDRVLLAEGKRQRYGTQFTSVDGKWQPRPLEDEANVDNRRAEAGLPRLAEYAKWIEQQYGGSPQK